MARTEIGTIIDELVTLEETLTPSVSAISAFTVYDEAPENVVGPAWINFPDSGLFPMGFGVGGATLTDDTHTIICACIKDRALLPQDEKMMRPLITQFPDLLAANLSLNSTVCQIDRVEYEYGFLEVLSSQRQSMFGVLFRVVVRLEEVFDFDT
jgi:hypothetical protein